MDGCKGCSKDSLQQSKTQVRNSHGSMSTLANLVPDSANVYKHKNNHNLKIIILVQKTTNNSTFTNKRPLLPINLILDSSTT
jgi:hypothetical protein